MQTAAVIGKEFREPILAAVAGLPPAELADALAILCNGEFIHQQSLYPIAEYAFAHPLTQEVALGSQLQDQRRRTHAAVGHAIQESEPDRHDENAALLAHHYEEAGEPLDAARFHARAAVWAGTRDLDGTLRHWQRVRELVRALPETDESAGLRLIACVQILVMGGFRLGLSEAAVDELYEEGTQLAERVGNVAIVTTLRAAYAARLVGLGRAREYFDLTIETLRIAEETGIREIRAGARVGAIYACFIVGRLREVARYLEECAELVGGDLEMGRREFGFSYAVWIAGVRAGLLGATGRLVESARALTHALRVARDSGIPENLGWTLGNIGVHTEYNGQIAFDELGDAKAAVFEALRIADDLGSAFSRAAACASVGTVHLTAGEWEEAERFLADALDISRTRRIGLEHEAATLARLARAQLGSGRTGAARATAEESVARATERGQRLWELLGQIALAESLAADQGTRGRTAVEQALRRAEELVEETGGRAYEPQIAEARARLARTCGDAETGERHLREAHRLYVEMGATGHARRLAPALRGVAPRGR